MFIAFQLFVFRMLLSLVFFGGVASVHLQCSSAILCLQVPRIAANLGLEETNYEALVDQLEADGIQVADTNLDPQDADYCQRRTRKYAWWHNMEAAIRKHGANTAAVDPILIQEQLQHTAQLARTLSKSVKYGIELKHFLFAQDSTEILQEKDALHKYLKAKAFRKQQMMDEPGSKRQKNNDGEGVEVAAVPPMNSGVQIQTGQRKTKKQSADEDDYENCLDDLVGDDGAAEPKWFDIHRNIHTDLGCPGEWSPVSDDKPPQRYENNVFYSSLRWRDRDIIAMLDLLSPPESLEKEVGVELHPWHVIQLYCNYVVSLALPCLWGGGCVIGRVCYLCPSCDAWKQNANCA